MVLICLLLMELDLACRLHMLLLPPRILFEDLWRGLGSLWLLQLCGLHVPRLHFVLDSEVRLIPALYLSLTANRENCLVIQMSETLMPDLNGGFLLVC